MLRYLSIFLFVCSAFGCRKPVVPSGAWLTYISDDRVVLRCNDTTTGARDVISWTMTCRSGRWVGGDDVTADVCQSASFAVASQSEYRQAVRCKKKYTCIFTDILWRVFRYILTKPVAHTLVSVNRRNNEARTNARHLLRTNCVISKTCKPLPIRTFKFRNSFIPFCLHHYD